MRGGGGGVGVGVLCAPRDYLLKRNLCYSDFTESDTGNASPNTGNASPILTALSEPLSEHLGEAVVHLLIFLTSRTRFPYEVYSERACRRQAVVTQTVDRGHTPRV